MLHSQISFEFKDYPSTDLSSFTDVQFFDDKYYFLSTHVNHDGTQEMSGSLWIMDEHGQLLETRVLGQLNQQYFKIIDKAGAVLRLAGAMQDENCKAIAVLADYNLESGELIHTSELPVCYGDRVIKRMLLVKGHQQETFIEFSHGFRVSPGFEQQSGLLKIDETGNLVVVIDEYQFPSSHLTYDFKGDGYLVMETWHMKFYTDDFTLRKDRYNAQSRYTPADFSYPQPFGKNMIIDMADLDIDLGPGCAIRLIDSHFHVQRELIIPPASSTWLQNYHPAYGGIHVLNDSTAWLVSNFGGTQSQHDTYFSVTKLDDELNVRCQKYYGFLSRYQIDGIYPTPDGGLLMYGYTEPSGSGSSPAVNNVYAMKIGPDCFTTSIEDPQFSISHVEAYPNPGTNTIRFDLEGFDATTLRCELYDATGNIVRKVSDLRNEIGVGELPQGQFFYRILDKDRIIGVGSWVKQ